MLSDDRPEDKVFAELGLRFEDVYQERLGEPPPDELLPPRSVVIPIGDFETALRMLPQVLPADVSYSFAYAGFVSVGWDDEADTMVWQQGWD